MIYKKTAGVRLQRSSIDLLMYADDLVLMSPNEDGLRKHSVVLRSSVKDGN